jgi:hypothetical protein
MEKGLILEIIGLLSLGFLLGFGIYKGILYIKKLKWENPIKRYIKGVVMDYLKELSNDN